MHKYQREIYQAKDGKKLLRKSFCAYFDILGFSEKIKKNDIDFFQTYLTTLESEIEYLNTHHDLKGEEGLKSFEIKIFTDNFVLGHPWFDEYGESELGNIFDAIAHIQLTFALSNIFIRGGIAMSDLYMDENIVLGPALIEAYELENSVAIYPRVILSKEVFVVVKKHINYYADHDSSPQSKEYLKDVDGQVFINYLQAVIEHNYHSEDKIFELLKKHKEIIISNVTMYKDNYKLYDKFKWIAEYHNFFCATSLSEFEKIDISLLKIDDQYFLKAIQKII